MTQPFTVQVGYSTHVANTVTVEATTLEQALEKAIEAANNDPAGWKSSGHVTDSYVDACCEGAHADPWGDAALPVPDRFTDAANASRDPDGSRSTGRPSKSPAAGS